MRNVILIILLIGVHGPLLGQKNIRQIDLISENWTWYYEHFSLEDSLLFEKDTISLFQGPSIFAEEFPSDFSLYKYWMVIFDTSQVVSVYNIDLRKAAKVNAGLEDRPITIYQYRNQEITWILDEKKREIIFTFFDNTQKVYSISWFSDNRITLLQRN